MSITYIVQMDGPGKLVKFGKTKNPKSRLQTLKTGLPWPLRLVAMVGTDVEGDLKRRFVQYRVQGEWFRPNGELAAWLVEQSEAGRLVRQTAVDQAYVNAVIKPRIREYLNGREPSNNAPGDLVRCILGDLLPSVAGREGDLKAATKGHVTDAMTLGFGPCMEAPVLHIPADAVEETVVAPRAPAEQSAAA